MVTHNSFANVQRDETLHYSFHCGQNDLKQKGARNLAAQFASVLGADSTQQHEPTDRKQSGASTTTDGVPQIDSQHSTTQSAHGTDSLSDNVSEESDDPSNPQLHREEKACQPLLEMLGIVNTEVKFKNFVITSEGGLLGNEILAKFPCVLNADKRRFFVVIGATDFVFFTKSTLMNLCDFAEKQNAIELVFIVDRKHPERTQYRSTMKMVDAMPLKSKDIRNLLEKGTNDLNSTQTLAEASFFLMEL